MKFIEKQCLNCNKLFAAPIREIKRGNGKYCCHKCAMQHIGKTRPKPKPNVKCALCGKLFYKNKSDMRKSRTGLFFCCKEHHNKAQRLGCMANILRPDWGEGKGPASYRRIAFLHNKAVCNRCGYKEYPEVLHIHHRDRNRKNNSIENLEVLCPTCHEIEHLLAGDGRYSPKKSHF